MDRFNISEEDLPWLEDMSSKNTILDDLNDDLIASELVALFSGDLDIDDIYSEDLEFLDDEY